MKQATERRSIFRAALVIALLLPSSAEAAVWLRTFVLEGAVRTRVTLVEAATFLQPGAPITDAVLTRATEDLHATGLYESVVMSLAMPREEAVRRMYLDESITAVDVIVRVVEKQSWLVIPSGELGAANRSGGVLYGDKNLFGWGTQVAVAGQIGELKTYILGGFRHSLFSFAPLTWSADGVYRRETVRYYAHHRRTFEVPTLVAGGSSRVGWRLTSKLEAQLGVLYNRISLRAPHRFESPAPPYNPRSGDLVLLQANFLYDRTVAPEGLRRGTTLRVFDELADNLWGSTFDYVKLDFQLGLFGQFFRTYPSASVRVVLTYPTSSTGVPITQLLRIGGSDLRGYFTDELHGDTLASVQLAEQVPLLRNIVLPWVGARFNLALAVFSDTAMVLERHPGGTTVVDLMQNKDVRAHLHSGAGAGLRVLLPGVAIPALRLDVSYGFDVASVAFNLSIATAVL